MDKDINKQIEGFLQTLKRSNVYTRSELISITAVAESIKILYENNGYRKQEDVAREYRQAIFDTWRREYRDNETGAPYDSLDITEIIKVLDIVDRKFGVEEK